MENLLSISPGLAIWTIVSFLLFLLILRRFAWKPILRALERREVRIQDAIETAERSRGESEKILAEQKEVLKGAREQARTTVADASAEAEKQGEEIVQRARKEAEALLERARSEIRQEEAQAIGNVRREAVEIALQAAARLLRRKMDDADHRRLVEEFIAESAKGGERESR